jgi:exopolysaccharide biosynthesis protein
MEYWKEKSVHYVKVPRTARVELIPCLPEGELLVHLYDRLKKEGQEVPTIIMNANFFHLDGGYSISGMKYSNGSVVERSLGGFYVYRDMHGKMQIDTTPNRTIHDFMDARWALESSPLLLPHFAASPYMEAAIAAEAHPRTAIGLTDTDVIFAVTDGRPSGMTCQALAEQFRRIGCHTALNLDGGRSSQLVIRGRQVNWQWMRRKVYAALAIYDS